MSDRAVRDLDEQEVEALHQKRDDLLAEIEDAGMLSPWAWPLMMETVTRLSGLGDNLAWLSVRYLQAVTIRRDAMFSPNVAQETLDGTADAAPVYRLHCGCGGATGEAPQTKRGGRWIRVGRCEACGGDLVEFDDEPYRLATLIVQGLGRDLYHGTPTPV